MTLPTAAASKSRCRVLIATTQGPVEVEQLTREDPEIAKSAVCIGGTTKIAGISSDYHRFVARPTGLIERLYKHGRFRLDVASDIDDGSSWQLGVLIAHALKDSELLAEKDPNTERIVWATGQVNVIKMTVEGIDHLDRKLRLSLEQLRAEVEAGHEVIAAWPVANAADVSQDTRSMLDASGVQCLELSGLQPLWAALMLPAAASGASRRRYRWRLPLPRRDVLVAGLGGGSALAVAGLAWRRLSNAAPEVSLSIVPIRTAPTAQSAPTGRGVPPKPRLTSVSYDYVHDGSNFHIRANVPYLEVYRRGGPVEGVEGQGGLFDQTLPELRVTVNNASPRNVVIVSVVANVLSSEVHREAIIVVESQTEGRLFLSNQGWADVENALLRFDVRYPWQKDESFPDVLPHKVEMGTLKDRVAVPLRNFVPVQFGQARQWQIVGEIEHGRAGARTVVRFKTIVLPTIWPGAPMGAGKPYELSYPAGKTGPVTAYLDPPEEVRPGQADTFRIRLKTDVTSKSRIRLDLKTIDEKVIQGPEITIDAFVPREDGLWKQGTIKRN